MRQRFVSRIWGFVCSAVLALAAAGAGGLHAQQPASPPQFGPPVGLAEAFQPDILRRDLQLFDDHFELDDNQSVILEALYSDYETAFRKRTEEIRAEIVNLTPTQQQQRELQLEQHRATQRAIESLVDRIRELREIETAESQRKQDDLAEQVKRLKLEMREGNVPAVEVDVMRQLMEQFNAVISRWQDEKRAMRDTFMNEARSLLDEAQLERWPAFERALRRVKTLGDGKLSGESVDLLRLVDELHLDQQVLADLAPTLLQFEIELDNALKARNTYIDEESRQRRAEVLTTGDVDAARAVIDQEVALRQAVRDVNRRYAESLAGQIGGAAGAELRDSFQRAAFARVFRTTLAQRSFDAMLQLPDLDAEDRVFIEQVASEYELVTESARLALIDVIRSSEPQQMRDRFLWQVARAGGGELNQPTEYPLIEAMKDQREQDRQFIDRALVVLSEQQIARLPAFVRPDPITQTSTDIQSGAHKPAPTEMTGRERQELARQFDADGDGQLSMEERAKLREELHRRIKASEAEHADE